jgi:hypothetical protein
MIISYLSDTSSQDLNEETKYQAKPKFIKAIRSHSTMSGHQGDGALSRELLKSPAVRDLSAFCVARIQLLEKSSGLIAKSCYIT